MSERRTGAGRIDTARLLDDTDLMALLVADGVALRKESATSYVGPCSKCGGTDRFVVKPAGSNGRGPACWCRQCWPEPGGDAIGYVRWRDSGGFIDACEVLARHNGHDLAYYRAGAAGPTPKASQSYGHEPRGEPEREHIYEDAAGEPVLLVRVFRLSDGEKDIRQFVPDDAGGWKPGGGDWPHGRPLYRLPEMLAADPDEPVFVVEGEKDADRLAALGLVVTTSCMGAGNAHHTDWSPLAGRDVVILPDHHRPGFHKYAEPVGALVTKADARRVRIVPLPGYPVGDDLPKAHGLDISDWLVEQGHDLPELLAAVDAAPDWKPTSHAANGKPVSTVRVISAADVEPEPVSWLWEPRIPRDALTILAGHPGVGKSYIACAIAAGVSHGRGLPGRPPGEPGRVLYVTAEDHLAKTLRPRLEASGADLSRIHFLVEDNGGGCIGAHVPNLATPEGLARLEAAINELRPDLVILDPVQSFQGGALDAHRVNEVRAFMAPLAALAERHGLALVLVAHMSKSGSRSAAMRIVGSIDHTAAPRSVLVAGADPDDEAERALFHVKANLGPQAEPIGYSLDSGVFGWKPETSLTAACVTGEPDPEGASALDEAVEFLREALADGPMPANDVEREAKAAGVAWATVRRAKSRAGVQSRREGAGWAWSLNPQDAQDALKGRRAS